MSSPPSSPDVEHLPAMHRGAIDTSMITTERPIVVMDKVRDVLTEMGVKVQPESTFSYRCSRPAKSGSPSSPLSEKPPHLPLYGESSSEDPGDEVRFSVELTKLSGLDDCYSLDIRRLKGNLRSYKFVYCTIRDRADLKA